MLFVSLDEVNVVYFHFGKLSTYVYGDGHVPCYVVIKNVAYPFVLEGITVAGVDSVANNFQISFVLAIDTIFSTYFVSIYPVCPDKH